MPSAASSAQSGARGTAGTKRQTGDRRVRARSARPTLSCESDHKIGGSSGSSRTPNDLDNWVGLVKYIVADDDRTRRVNSLLSQVALLLVVVCVVLICVSSTLSYAPLWASALYGGSLAGIIEVARRIRQRRNRTGRPRVSIHLTEEETARRCKSRSRSKHSYRSAEPNHGHSRDATG